MGREVLKVVPGDGRLGQSADMLQVEAVFEAFEGFLDVPALVVQFLEAKAREVLFVEQVGHGLVHASSLAALI